MYSSINWVVWVLTLAGDIVLCSWAWHFTLTIPISTLSTLVYKWLPDNFKMPQAWISDKQLTISETMSAKVASFWRSPVIFSNELFWISTPYSRLSCVSKSFWKIWPILVKWWKLEWIFAWKRMLVFFLFSNSYFNVLLFCLFFCYQGIPEEELLRQQQELFQQARLQQAQVLDYFCDGLTLDNVESRNTSSCFMLQQPEISVSLVDHLACTAV